MILYESDKSLIICGDCREADLPEIDLIVTDPPYGVNYKSNHGRNHDSMIGDDGSLDIKVILTDICRSTMSHGRHVYVFGPYPDPEDDDPLLRKVLLTWDKGSMSMGDLSLPWSRTTEDIVFLSWVPSKWERANGKGNLSARLRKGSVLRASAKHGKMARRHPTEKPVKLLMQLIESSSMRGEVVLDPFAGVGSTGVAALLTGRRTVMVEADLKYAKIAVERVKEAEDLAKRIDAA